MVADISIIIPCYNHGAYLDEALGSLIPLKELGIQAEVILVDDGSTDPFTSQKIDQIEASKICIVIRQANSGVGVARNTGINRATTDYIIPLDADNTLVCSTIGDRLAYMRTNPDVAVVYGDAEFFGSHGGIWSNSPLELAKMLTSNQIDNCVLLRKQAWHSVQGYHSLKTFQSHADWLMWFSLLSLGWRFQYLPGSFFRYRVLGDSMLRTDGKSQSKLALIMQFAFPIQQRLADRFLNQGSLSKPEFKTVLSNAASMLAYYQIIYGSFWKGIKALYWAIYYRWTGLPAYLKIASVGLVKRGTINVFGFNPTLAKR